MAKRHGRTTAAPQTTDDTIDMVIDTFDDADPSPDDIADLETVDAHLAATGDAWVPIGDDLALTVITARIDPNLSDGDADAIASIVSSGAVDTGAATIATSIASAERFAIGMHAAKLMIKRGIGLSAVTVIIGQTLQRHADLTGRSVPRAWRDLVSLDHALKCWIPGTCASSDIPRMWKTTRPFYRLPDYVVKHITAGTPGFDHGGMVCDYWARIHPSRLNTRMVADFLELTDRVSRRDYLREYLGGDA